MINIYIKYLVVTILLFSFSFSNALDLENLQQECAKLGFEPRTEENGNCVLKLLNKLNSSNNIKQEKTVENDIADAQKRIVERQHQYAKDVELAQKQREIDLLKKQQAELYELQRRSVAAQEKAAQAQSDANSNTLFLNGVQMFLGTGAYTRPPPAVLLPNRPCIYRNGYSTCD